MNWTNLWMSLFGTTQIGGIDMGFWIAMGVTVIVVIAMNLVFWTIRPSADRFN